MKRALSIKKFIHTLLILAMVFLCYSCISILVTMFLRRPWISKDFPRRLPAKSLFSGEYATIEISARELLPGSIELDGCIKFRSDMSMDEIFEALDENSFTEIKKTASAIYMKKETSDKTKTDHFCISMSGSQYVFGGMCGRVIVDISADSQKAYKWILLPVHYISSDETILGGNNRFTLYANVDYKLNCSKEDICSFYQDCSWYEVSLNNDYISIDGFTTEIESMTGALHYEHLSDDVPFVIKLTEKTDGLYFSILSSSVID